MSRPRCRAGDSLRHDWERGRRERASSPPRRGRRSSTRGRSAGRPVRRPAPFPRAPPTPPSHRPADPPGSGHSVGRLLRFPFLLLAPGAGWRPPDPELLTVPRGLARPTRGSLPGSLPLPRTQPPGPASAAVRGLPGGGSGSPRSGG